ncbi:hypothetical protein SM124_22225 [Bacillus sp. 31A1R]|uniref:Uncharacterized protein n=1 Tax=Robertmurraya mangrovi TaxID=3098077 RepID=A0ABU5J4Y2_9BACI|nr:hypothetical protein [Bacillus sp. 31A1R]
MSFGSLGKIGLSSYKTYERWAFKVQLTNEGYFMEAMDKRTYEVHKELVRYDQMEEVVISKALNYIPNTTNIPLYTARYFVNVVLFIIWRDDSGERRVRNFTHSNKNDLDEWLEMFDQHNIPITVTDLDFRGVPTIKLLASIENVKRTTYKWDGKFHEIINVGTVTREKPLQYIMKK